LKPIIIVGQFQLKKEIRKPKKLLCKKPLGGTALEGQKEKKVLH